MRKIGKYTAYFDEVARLVGYAISWLPLFPSMVHFFFSKVKLNV